MTAQTELAACIDAFDAAYIVTACKAHDELVAALRAWIELFEARGGPGYEGDTLSMRLVVRQARAALASSAPEGRT